MPGSVVAVGVLLSLAWVDHRIQDLGDVAGVSIGLLFTGSALGMVFAYVVRFLALGFQPLEAQMARLSPTLDDAARGLGADRLEVMWRVHLPLLRVALLSGALLVFVETIKELPATVLLRPLGGDTLATAVWQSTSESLWQAAAPPAVAIIAGRARSGDRARAHARAQRGRRDVPVVADEIERHHVSEMSVEVSGLSRSFGLTRAVDDVTLEVRTGEIFGVLGPSGCGKTTLLRLIAGFERPEAGASPWAAAVVAGDGTWVPPERRRIGMVFQDYALFPHLTVERNVPSGCRGGASAAITQRALELVGLQHKADRHPHELSGGERQRVALARALAPGPDVVLLDEPFSNLDASLRADLRREVELILRDAGATAILVTHDQEEALTLADRLALMRDGPDRAGRRARGRLRPARPSGGRRSSSAR